MGKPSTIWLVCYLEENITDPRNARMEDTSRRQRRMEASSEEGHSPEGAVAPHMEWNMQLHRLITVDRT
jgi:hypothetical protein